MSEEQIAQLKQYIEQLQQQVLSPKVRQIVNGDIQLIELTGLEFLSRAAKDPQAFAQFKMLIDKDPQLRQMLFDLFTTILVLSPLDSLPVQNIDGNPSVITIKRVVYKLSKMGVLLMCIPLFGQCPANVIEMLSEVARQYSDNEKLKSSLCSICNDGR